MGGLKMSDLKRVDLGAYRTNVSIMRLLHIQSTV